VLCTQVKLGINMSDEMRSLLRKLLKRGWDRGVTCMQPKEVATHHYMHKQDVFWDIKMVPWST
jgi:hypothetical protein